MNNPRQNFTSPKQNEYQSYVLSPWQASETQFTTAPIYSPEQRLLLSYNI